MKSIRPLISSLLRYSYLYTNLDSLQHFYASELLNTGFGKKHKWLSVRGFTVVGFPHGTLTIDYKYETSPTNPLHFSFTFYISTFSFSSSSYIFLIALNFILFNSLGLLLNQISNKKKKKFHEHSMALCLRVAKFSSKRFQTKNRIVYNKNPFPFFFLFPEIIFEQKNFNLCLTMKKHDTGTRSFVSRFYSLIL